MKLLSYNIRGLGGMAKKKEVRNLIKELKTDCCCLQETKLEKIEDRMVRRLWGKGNIDWAFKAAEGNSGGILTIWNADKFQKSSVWDTRGLLAINGTWLADGSSCTLINVYAPNILKHKWELWDIIALIAKQYKDSRLGIIGDFNAIREQCERIGRNQKIDLRDMSKFDEFITNSNLTEIQISGKKYTWYRPDGTCKSKLDRLLVNDEWRNKWSGQLLRGGRRTILDHRPIFVQEEQKDWGPKPFKMFNWWIKKKSFVDLVESKWNAYDFQGWTGFRLKEKLKALKLDTKNWSKNQKGDKDLAITQYTEEIQKIDAIDDTLGLDEAEASNRAILMEQLATVMNQRETELIQKSKVHWAKEGDVNSALFHKFLNCRINGDDFRNDFRKSVGNGKDTLFWHDEWLEGESLKNKFPRLYRLSNQKNEHIGDMGSWINDTWIWNWEWVRSLSHRNTVFFNKMNDMVNRYTFEQDREDTWKWTTRKKNGYTTSLSYWKMAEMEEQSNTDEKGGHHFKLIWKRWASRKAITMAWRFLHNRLPTKQNLQRRCIIPPSENLCTFCSEQPETAQHILLHCPTATRLWQLVHDWLGVSTAPSFSPKDHCIQHSFLIPGDDKGGMGTTLWIGVSWHLWNLRNDIIFNGSSLNLEKTFWKVKIDLWNWMKAKGLIDINTVFSIWSGDPLSCY
ncbi:hypothetical protein ACS0TY_001153 [Phlomoides rotata]